MKIEVYLSGREFVKFGLFNTFRHGKGWHRPALFAAILAAFAAACFALHDRRGAVLLGGVLLVVALGLPAAYFLSFFLSLRRQGAGLARGKYVYTIGLYDDERGITVGNGDEHTAYSWEQVYHAYRTETASYLYITPQRAYLIPHDCVGKDIDRLWALIQRRVPTDRQTMS